MRERVRSPQVFLLLPGPTLRLTARECKTLNALFGVAYDQERLKSRPSVGQLLGNLLKRRKAVGNRTAHRAITASFQIPFPASDRKELISSTARAAFSAFQNQMFWENEAPRTKSMERDLVCRTHSWGIARRHYRQRDWYLPALNYDSLILFILNTLCVPQSAGGLCAHTGCGVLPSPQSQDQPHLRLPPTDAGHDWASHTFVWPLRDPAWTSCFGVRGSHAECHQGG